MTNVGYTKKSSATAKTVAPVQSCIAPFDPGAAWEESAKDVPLSTTMFAQPGFQAAVASCAPQSQSELIVTINGDAPRASAKKKKKKKKKKRRRQKKKSTKAEAAAAAADEDGGDGDDEATQSTKPNLTVNSDATETEEGRRLREQSMSDFGPTTEDTKSARESWPAWAISRERARVEGRASASDYMRSHAGRDAPPGLAPLPPPPNARAAALLRIDPDMAESSIGETYRSHSMSFENLKRRADRSSMRRRDFSRTPMLVVDPASTASLRKTNTQSTRFGDAPILALDYNVLRTKSSSWESMEERRARKDLLGCGNSSSAEPSPDHHNPSPHGEAPVLLGALGVPLGSDGSQKMNGRADADTGWRKALSTLAALSPPMTGAPLGAHCITPLPSTAPSASFSGMSPQEQFHWLPDQRTLERERAESPRRAAAAAAASAWASAASPQSSTRPLFAAGAAQSSTSALQVQQRKQVEWAKRRMAREGGGGSLAALCARLPEVVGGRGRSDSFATAEAVLAEQVALSLPAREKSAATRMQEDSEAISRRAIDSSGGAQKNAPSKKGTTPASQLRKQVDWAKRRMEREHGGSSLAALCAKQNTYEHVAGMPMSPGGGRARTDSLATAEAVLAEQAALSLPAQEERAATRSTWHRPNIGGETLENNGISDELKEEEDKGLEWAVVNRSLHPTRLSEVNNSSLYFASTLQGTDSFLTDFSAYSYFIIIIMVLYVTVFMWLFCSSHHPIVSTSIRSSISVAPR